MLTHERETAAVLRATGAAGLADAPRAAAVAVDAVRASAEILGLGAIHVGANRDQRRRVGHKAWQLARLVQAGLPVPPGFVIPVGAIPTDCTSAAQLPAPLVAAICRAYARLGAMHVAVRSSALDEDSHDESAAGLYASYLNVRGEAALIEAVFACWQARQAPRARLGRAALHDVGMAVLVQAQVDAEAAGVLFTADPLASGSNDCLVINAVWGLAEPLAAGRVSGDVFRAHATGRLLAQTVSRKERMLTVAGEQAVPPGRVRRPALTAPQIRRLAVLARQVGAHFAGGSSADANGLALDIALDIEFALVAGRPVLLQARPVPRAQRVPGEAGLAAYLAGEQRRLADHCTSLRAASRISGEDIVFSAGNVRELLPTPSQFSFGLFRHLFAGRAGAIAVGRRRLGYRLGPEAGEDLFVLIGGQAYFNLEIDAATYDIGVPLPVDALISAVHSDPRAASYPELGLYPRLQAESAAAQAAEAAFRERLLASATRCGLVFDRLRPVLERRRQRVVPCWEKLDARALQREFAASLANLRQLARRFVIAARFAFFFAERVSRQLRATGLTAEQAARCYASLLQGLPGSRITEQGLALERLADGRIDAAAYLADYGHMASNELELLLPRLAEQPAELERQVAELRASGRRPAQEFARHASRRRRIESFLRRAVGASADTTAFFADLDAAQVFLPWRETFKYYLTAEYARLRPLLQSYARRFGMAADDLFHLTPEEVLMLPAEPNDSHSAHARPELAALCAERRQQRAHARELARRRPLSPVLFASRLATLGAPANDAPAGEALAAGQIWSATPIAPGVAEGTVRLLQLDEEALEASLSTQLPAMQGGEILVAPSANLGLAPLFRAAAGVVVETGGVLAHSACQAREAGIPALVLADAIRLLKEGDRVRIDAARGEVVLLARPTPSEGLR